MQIAREIGDLLGESNALGNLGVAYAKLGNRQKSIEYRLQSLHISQSIGDLSGEGIDCYNLSLNYEIQGALKIALEYAERALAIARQIKSPWIPTWQQQVSKLLQKLQSG